MKVPFRTYHSKADIILFSSNVYSYKLAMRSDEKKICCGVILTQLLRKLTKEMTKTINTITRTYLSSSVTEGN